MENSGTPRGNPAQHTLRTSVALHLLPGALVFAFYLAAAPSFIHRGVPPGLALLLGFLFVGIPLELGYLLYLGKRRNGALTLHGIVFFRERLPRWQYAGLFVLLFTIAFGALFLTSPATAFLATRLFAWLPPFLLPDGSSTYPPFAPTAVLVTLILGLVVDGFINPVVEELYFRGYLLPRITRLGWLAPLMNAFLFSLQHYWQPYNFPLLFLIQLAVVYVVWWKRNIYIGMLAHSAGNIIGATISLISFAGTS